MNNKSKYGNTEKKVSLFFFFLFLQIYNRTRFLKKQQEATDDITGESRTDQSNNELSSDHK